ncbi:MAG: hypothetical protein LBJ11_01010 [Oscillospiraceae bacterium]|nr:hypothetical protein [Oscillospiraceae bacterium]
MGKLIILSGPSGVGKGPLTAALAAYLRAVGRGLRKHVLYTSRSMRPGEAEGESYFFRSAAELRRLHVESAGRLLFQIHGKGDWQMMDLDALREELTAFDVVLLEIYYEQVPTVLDFCRNEGFPAKQIFVSPLDMKELQSAGEECAAAALKAVMQTKLANRGTETAEKQRGRAQKAPEELAAALAGGAEIFPNCFGEDNGRLWGLLQEFVAVPGALEIAKTFLAFVKTIQKDAPVAARQSRNPHRRRLSQIRWRRRS